MARDRNKLVMFEDAQLIFRNFSGKETRYNQEGNRNFCVLLDENTARNMELDGWNVKWPKQREEGEEEVRDPHLQVAVNFRNRPPRIVMITSNSRTILDKDTVSLLDNVDIKTVDLTVNPYEWVVGDKGGVKAYLQTMYITIHEDPLDLKYAEEMPGE